jgi:hypothetical protein
MALKALACKELLFEEFAAFIAPQRPALKFANRGGATPVFLNLPLKNSTRARDAKRKFGGVLVPLEALKCLQSLESRDKLDTSNFSIKQTT